MKIGRNVECPCGSKLKYKHCCLGKIDWPQVTEEPLARASRYFTIRGKNLQFISSLLRALQIEYSDRNPDFAKIKRAFTPEVVQKVYSLILDLWPDLDDYERCIAPEKHAVTALFTGNYQPEAVFRAITRLSLYCDKIYLVDPFLRPSQVRDEFSPLLHPEEHRATTIKFAFLWLSLAPWIDAGIVAFVRPMHDFIPGLWHEVIELQDRRFKANPELQREIQEEINREMQRVGPLDRGMGELYILSFSDEALREMFSEFKDVFESPEQFIGYIQRRRDQHPYYVDRLPGQRAEYHLESSGSVTNWQSGCAL